MTEFDINRQMHVENAISDALYYIDREDGANRAALHRIISEALKSKNQYPATKKELRDRCSSYSYEGIEPCQRIGAALLVKAGLSVKPYGPQIVEVFEVGELDIMGRLEEVIATVPGAVGSASDNDLGVMPLRPFVSESQATTANIN